MKKQIYQREKLGWTLLINLIPSSPLSNSTRLSKITSLMCTRQMNWFRASRSSINVWPSLPAPANVCWAPWSLLHPPQLPTLGEPRKGALQPYSYGSLLAEHHPLRQTAAPCERQEAFCSGPCIVPCIALSPTQDISLELSGIPLGDQPLGSIIDPFPQYSLHSPCHIESHVFS